MSVWDPETDLGATCVAFLVTVAASAFARLTLETRVGQFGFIALCALVIGTAAFLRPRDERPTDVDVESDGGDA